MDGLHGKIPIENGWWFVGSPWWRNGNLHIEKWRKLGIPLGEDEVSMMFHGHFMVIYDDFLDFTQHFMVSNRPMASERSWKLGAVEALTKVVKLGWKIESSCWHRIEKKGAFSLAISGRRTKNLGWSHFMWFFYWGKPSPKKMRCCWGKMRKPDRYDFLDWKPR